MHEQFHYQVFVAVFETFTQEQLELVESLLHDIPDDEFPPVVLVEVLFEKAEFATQHVYVDPDPAHEVLV